MSRQHKRKRENLFFVTCIALLFLFSSCAYKKSSYHLVAKNIDAPIFIQMPENVLVFENISYIVYTSLWNRFRQLGYRLVDKNEKAFLLKVKIKNLEPIHKLISSDVIMHSMQIKLELFCQAFDKNKRLLVQKNFSFLSLVCKPKNSIMNSGAFEAAYKELMEKRAAPKIEQHFRPYWTSKESK